jgi:hypothetical protein
MDHSNARSETPDVSAVAAAATEYFQAWFAGDGDRMRAVLHPALSKCTPVHPGGPELTLDEDTAESMVSDTARGPRTQYEPWQDVHVVDVAGDIATVMVRSQPFDEYLHLGRFGGRWLIINALYVRHDT